MSRAWNWTFFGSAEALPGSAPISVKDALPYLGNGGHNRQGNRATAAGRSRSDHRRAGLAALDDGTLEWRHGPALSNILEVLKNIGGLLVAKIRISLQALEDHANQIVGQFRVEELWISAAAA